MRTRILLWFWFAFVWWFVTLIIFSYVCWPSVYLLWKNIYWDLWKLDHKEGCMLKNCCSQIVVLEKTLESSLYCKEIKPVNPKGNQPWIFIGGTDAEAEAPVLWPPDAKNWPMEKILMLGKIEGRRRRERQKMRWLNGITDAMNMNLGRLQEIVKDRVVWYAVVHVIAESNMT